VVAYSRDALPGPNSCAPAAQIMRGPAALDSRQGSCYDDPCELLHNLESEEPMMIPLRPERHYAHRRRCSFAPLSLHIYRRALMRRIGLIPGARPASILDALAQALLAARTL